MTDETKRSKTGPSRSGSLYWTKSGWRARIRVDIDGVTVQRVFDPKTFDKGVARIKMRREIKRLESGEQPSAETAAAPITVADYAEKWIARRKALGIAAVEYEDRFMERVWLPALGRIALADVTKADVQAVLDDAAMGVIRPKPRREGHEPEPYSRQSISHMRATIVRLFEAAWKEELITENRAAKADVPDIDEEQKPRAVLTDAEIGLLVACPKADAEIKMLLLISRTVGGLRAGDLNRLDWQQFSPEFETLTFVRRKTRKKRPAPETHPVPAPVRPFIAAWHERQRNPKTGELPEAGPVFPVRRGKRAGLAKKASNMSYADRLRRELVKAGVERHELHHETATTLPVDFHSTRRAYGTALARAGVNEQTAMLLTGHADSKVHRRYLESLERQLPPSAVPELCSDDAQLILRKPANDRQVLETIERDTGFEPVTPSLGSLCSTS
jgi:integrase